MQLVPVVYRQLALLRCQISTAYMTLIKYPYANCPYIIRRQHYIPIHCLLPILLYETKLRTPTLFVRYSNMRSKLRIGI